MIIYIITDVLDSGEVNEDTILHICQNKKELINYANDFYQRQFEGDDYDEKFVVKTVATATRLFDGNGYAVLKCNEIIKD